MFIMLSGATLMRYRDRYDTKTFFQKRFLRTLIPFIFWSIFFYVLRWGIVSPSESFGLLEFWNLFTGQAIEPVFWFFWPLFALYLAFPVLYHLSDKQNVLLYIAGAIFLLASLLPPIAGMLGLSWFVFDKDPLLLMFLFYAVLGYLASTVEIEKKWRLVIYGAAIAVMILRFVYTAVMSAQLQIYANTLSYSDIYFTDAIPALAIFVWFRYHDFSKLNESTTKLLAKVSACSFGVYLIHRFFVQEVVFGLLHLSAGSFVVRLVAPILIWVTSVAVVLVLKRVPVLRRIVP